MLYVFHKEPGRSRFLCECGDVATATQLLATLTVSLTNLKAHPAAPSSQATNDLLQELVSQFESDIDQDEPINGGDAVDFLSEFIPRVRQALIQSKKPQTKKRSKTRSR
jgi:hypothetical protein